MAFKIQILFYSFALFVCVYGHHRERHDESSYETPRLVDLINPLNLVKLAARITYPITSGVNNAVGHFLGPEYDRTQNYGERDRFSGYHRERNGNRIKEANVLASLLNRIRGNGHDTKQTYSFEYSNEFEDSQASRSNSDSADVERYFERSRRPSSASHYNSLEENGPVLGENPDKLDSLLNSYLSKDGLSLEDLISVLEQVSKARKSTSDSDFTPKPSTDNNGQPSTIYPDKPTDVVVSLDNSLKTNGYPFLTSEARPDSSIVNSSVTINSTGPLPPISLNPPTGEDPMSSTLINDIPVTESPVSSALTNDVEEMKNN